jgi:hypothetical protein
MAKIKLDLEPSPDIPLIAISSHVNDHRLCWSLNKALGLQMARRRQDIEDQGPEGNAWFAAFDQFGDPDGADWSLIANHAPEGVLVPEQRQADFFLVPGTDDPLAMEHLLRTVRQADFVLTAYIVQANSLRSAHKLLT